MIAFKDDLPLLERAHGMVTAFRGDWLRQALARAARKAGYAEFWQAEDLTRSVVFYLQFHYTDNTIAVPRLKDAVRTALRQIGYHEVARHFGARGALRRVSLAQPALAGVGMGVNEDREEFFRKLSLRLRSLRPNSAGVVHFYDLAECARALRLQGTAAVAADPATADDGLDVLKTEIVEFVRGQLASLGWSEVRFCIS